MAVGQRQTRSGLNVSIGGGLVGGALAYLASFLVIYVMKSGQIQESFQQTTGQMTSAVSQADLPGSWQIVGWLFYSAHNVDIVSHVSMMGQSRTQATSMQQGQLWEAWFIVLPIVVLVLAGVAVAMLTDSWDVMSGVQAGGSVVLGYGALAIAGVFLTKWGFSASQMGMEASISVGPDKLMGIGLAGIVYPLVLGAVGGAIGGALQN